MKLSIDCRGILRRCRRAWANRHYWYRRYGQLIPLQPCHICGRWHWAGWPYPSIDQIRRWRFWQWKPGWGDYCSQECCDEDLARLA